MSEARRQRRLLERNAKKLYNKIRLETIKKINSLTPEERLKLEEEHKEFLNRMENGLQL